jgi:hypothetical protein
MSGVQLFLPRPTAVRSLRNGDQILAAVGPGQYVRATITDLEEHEQSRTITLHGILDNGEPTKKKSRPWDMVDRIAQPGEPAPGAESRMVHAEEMWKWLHCDMNDPEGSGDMFVVKTFRRVHSDETGGEAIELRMQSKVNPKELRICTFKPKGTIGFKGHR